ncbi:sarcosine oxidase subunit gamma family protein [Paracoccaceae bacterium Fryx2]|nr:sarcosine oxidase subunit gamma family protein [Paracoccaceae bacterium Fryx2]
MSDPVSALQDARFDGFARISEIGPLGMISLRCKRDAPGLAAAVQAAVGLALPGPRAIVQDGGRSAGWMSPDEYLLLLPHAEVPGALERLSKTLAGVHHLAVDVSDARSVFRIKGPLADQVVMKLCPVDLATLPAGELRRSRAAQVACALWREGDGITLVAFRSVAGYVMGLLSHAAQPGSELWPG